MAQFFERFQPLLDAYGITEKQYLERILPHIPERRLWDYEFLRGFLSERERRKP